MIHHLVGMEASRSGAHLVWEDLAVVLPSYGGLRPAKKLVQGLAGYAQPGRILAVMGPSGSGKSTFLDSLTGRLAGNLLMGGTILLNGRKRKLNSHGLVAYVTQENTLLGTLTVRETIDYSAQLRLPGTMTKEQVRDVVEETMDKMGLSDCGDRPLGNWHLRGISGGEKKRLSIALEILTQPSLLFLDEPTTGLDVASAYIVAMTLHQMAREVGTTIIASVHQPSGDIFALFDDLCLLSGGEMVYFGDAEKAIELFRHAGFHCPSRRNPSDHFLRCINTDFDSVNRKIRELRRFQTVATPQEGTSVDPLIYMETSEIKAKLIYHYMKSQQAVVLKRKTTEISKLECEVVDGWKKGSHASWWKQLTTLTRRSFVNMRRDYGYYWIRILVYVVVSLCVGTVFFDLGTSYEDISARSSSAGFVFAFMSFMSIGGFPSFVEEMKVFTLERLSGHYGVLVFVLSNLISSFPYLLAVSLCSSAIMYHMVGLHPGFSHFLFFTLDLYASLAVVEGVMMFIASLVSNFLMGVGAGVGILGVMMLAAGYVRSLPELPKTFWRYPISYVSFGSWALQGQYKNDMLGLEFDSSGGARQGTKLTGEYVVTKIFRVRLDHSKWLDLGMIFALLISYRLMFCLILKFKEQASPFVRLPHARLSTHGKYALAVNKKLPVSSRNQSLHPFHM